jgi:hypothetical protein
MEIDEAMFRDNRKNDRIRRYILSIYYIALLTGHSQAPV